MSTTASRARGTVPTRMAAGIAALALLAMPMPAGAHGQTRTVLLTLTDGTSLSQLADNVAALGGQVLNTLEIADSLLVELPTGATLPAGSAEIPDTPMRVNGAQQTYYDTEVPTYRETIGAPDNGNLGEGVKVALVDTGVADVPDLVHVTTHVNVSDGPDGDALGHGTFLAGLIGGQGEEFSGVAPGAEILDIQVADAKGNTSLSKVLAGLQAAADNQADVVNLSLSTESPLPPTFDPLSVALDNLWVEEGVTVVVAAGNDGPEWGTVGSPGNTPRLITVGALDEHNTADTADDTVAVFSSRGSIVDGTKPDLVAPGVSLVSTAAPDSIAVKRNRNSLVDGGYMRGSGTSMSAAVVTGAVAAVLQENDQLQPNGVKALLLATSSKNVQPDDGAGAGALNLDAALAAADEAQSPDEQPSFDGNPSEYGPDESDAEAWADFAAAWEAKNEDGLKAAWAKLAPRTRIWAARAWSMAVVANNLTASSDDFEARAWSARAWSAEEWLARAWSARAWSARAWSDEEWLARAWSARAWSDEEWLARAWSARAWSASDWAARAWSARAWSARAWSARAWSARAWSARAWSDEDWEARAWSARAWSARAWSARAWSARAWSARAWSARAWSARAWSARAWSARAWSDYMWEARAWSARAWSDDTWTMDQQ